MRPINKGITANIYTVYSAARHDLAEVIWYYCSYCEMGVKNMIEVEHVHPVAHNGDPLSWDNFLLSCKYCNTVKSNNNASREGYLWPDQDNTDLAFEYSESNVIEPKIGLTLQQSVKAQDTINLMGLDRIPDGLNDPTEADTRWRSREEAWTYAKKSCINWHKVPTQTLADQIADTAFLNGHYSIWRKVFKNEQVVLDAIDVAFSAKGLYKEYTLHGNRVIRPLGVI